MPIDAPGREAIQDLLAGVHRLLSAHDDANVARFASALLTHASALRSVAPREQPVVAYLPRLTAPRAQPVAAALLNQVQKLGPQLAWSQSYRADQVSAHFLARYAWTELVGPRGPIADKHCVCGFLLLGPDVEYPEHAHAPEEIYLPLTAGSTWRMNGAAWKERQAGDVIHHPPWAVHAMRTTQHPLLALYLWQDGDLKQPPTFDV